MQVCRGVPRLLVAFSPSVSRADDAIRIAFEETTVELPPATARSLRDALGDALVRRREFLRTVGEHRPDGSYVVERRGADATGNSVRFDSFDDLRDEYRAYPDRITVEAVERAGVTGSRRHLLLRHVAEHPGFDCELTCENPLTVEKRRARQR